MERCARVLVRWRWVVLAVWAAIGAVAAVRAPATPALLNIRGGSARETNLLGTYIYRLGIGGGDFGTSAAVAVFMLALTVVLTAPYVRSMFRQERET